MVMPTQPQGPLVTTTSELNAKFPSAATLADVASNPSTISLGALLSCWDANSSTWNRARGNTSGLWVQGQTVSGVSYSSRPVVIGGVDSGTLARTIATDTTGRIRVINVRNIVADGTTDAPTRFPAGGDFISSSSGVALVKATGGRLHGFLVIYTGATSAGRYLHLHNAASATTPTTSTLLWSWPINTSIPRIEWDAPFDMCCPNGIKFTVSSTERTETTATTETFVVAGIGA